MMNWPFLIGTQANRPSPVLERPIRRWRDGDSLAGMGLGYVVGCGCLKRSNGEISVLQHSVLTRNSNAASLVTGESRPRFHDSARMSASPREPTKPARVWS